MKSDLQVFLRSSEHSALVQLLAERGELKRFRKNSIFILEGEYSEGLYVIISGRVSAFSVDKNERQVSFGIFEPGEYVGELFLDGLPRSANVMALEATVCSVVNKKTLLAFIADHPEFALQLLARVIQCARLATENVRNLVFFDVYGRLTRLLDKLAVTDVNGNRYLLERLTHAELAARVGCGREMVSRILKDLERGGYISVDKKIIQLHKKLPANW
jgi:CRP/FNR family transcriptional regulator, cyclic AMP receptor protein